MIIAVVYRTTLKVHFLLKRHTAWRGCSIKPGAGGSQSSKYSVLHHDLQLSLGLKYLR